jgi:putative nucleotidyltransferase with HDIG domain
MSTGGQKKTRSERVAALELAPGRWERALANLGRRDVLVRITLGMLSAVAMCVVIRGWNPPPAYRIGYTPTRDVVATQPFSKADPAATDAARNRARRQARCVYVHDSQPLVQLRASLRNTLLEVAAAAKLADLDPKIWERFKPPSGEDAPPPAEKARQEAFQKFREAIAGEEKLAKLDKAVADALALFQENGLLEKPGDGNPEEITVYPAGQPKARRLVKLPDVLIGDGEAIQKTLAVELDSTELAARLFAWLRPGLKDTLTLDHEATSEARQAAAAVVEEVYIHYDAGQTLAPAGAAIGPEQMELLRLEYDAATARRTLGKKLIRAAAVLAMTLILFGLCGFYMQRRKRQLLVSLRRLSVILLLSVATVGFARWAAADAWRAEIVGPLLFGQIMAIAYRQELALLFSGVVSLILVLALGFGLGEFLVLMGVTATAVMQLGCVRSRSKLIHVGFFSGVVAVVATVVVAVLDNQPIDWPLLQFAARAGAWTLAAGFLMTGLLPFVERIFGVLTDISLLELGDVAHPLLQELVRRAPSTYNHSITVGTIAEAAADAIGGRGLLVRVGAYFHDIGKMLKPGYFIENQGDEANRHEALLPAMSTLVIIAHIKDGANLARQHHLPEPLIEFIQQHHGTTLVGYFFDRASRQSKSDPNGANVDESTYRYPGPKPQTKEAAVMMLADAVESASRTLVGPTPKRIQSLVREIAERRLQDGQFDESGLTLRELRTIENSMIKSVIAIYHGRVKYPEH